MELFGVGVDFQIVIVLCCVLGTEGNLVDFRLCIVIVVDGLEGRRDVEIVDVST